MTKSFGARRIVFVTFSALGAGSARASADFVVVNAFPFPPGWGYAREFA